MLRLGCSQGATMVPQAAGSSKTRLIMFHSAFCIASHWHTAELQ